MTGSTAARRLISRLICVVMRRFWPAAETLNRYSSEAAHSNCDDIFTDRYRLGEHQPLQIRDISSG
jgi:hypothetical protein